MPFAARGLSRVGGAVECSLRGVPGGGWGWAPPGFLGSTPPLRSENATYRQAPDVGVLILTLGELLRLDFGRFPSWRFRMLLNLECAF